MPDSPLDCQIELFEPPQHKQKKKQMQTHLLLFYGAGDEARCIFALGENQGIAAIELAASNSPLDCCIWWFEPQGPKRKDRFLSDTVFMERVTRLELATSTLARWRSTG